MRAKIESDGLYWSLRFLFRIAFGIFFARIQGRHLERIPSSGPIILASNHPNDLIDPLLLGTICPRRISFVAKNTLFSFGPFGPIFRRFGVIPIYRRQDADPAEIEDLIENNKAAFVACRELLARDGVITMFPEGVSHRDPQVKRLKTGTARIALESEASCGFNLGVLILPVGLTFSRWNRFRSEVLIRIGRPIAVEPYRRDFSSDPQEAVRRLTGEIERALHALTVHTEETTLARLARQVHEVFHHRLALPAELAGPLFGEKEILEAIHYFQKIDPPWFFEFKERMEQYHQRLRGLGLRDRVFSHKTSPWFPFLIFLKALTPALLGFPVALFGILNNYLPYRLPTLIARRMEYLNAEGTIKFLSGAFLFPIFYLTQCICVGWFIGVPYALLYLLVLPVSGLFTFHYWIWLRRIRNSLSFALLYWTRKGIVQELRVERERLIADLSERQETFLREVLHKT